MPATRRPSPSDDIKIAALLRAINRQKVWIALFAIAAGVATFVALTFVAPLYSSQARILIEREDNSYKRPAASTIQSERRSVTDQEAVESQVQVLLSRDLAMKVTQDLKLIDKPEFSAQGSKNFIFQKILNSLGLKKTPSEETLQERVLNTFIDKLDVSQLQKSRVIAVSFQSENPETAAMAANRLAEFYLNWQQREKLKQTKQASIWLSAQIAGAREASLRQSLSEMKQLASKGNENQIKMRALEREAKANREFLESYLSRYRDASARRDQASVPSHASIISRAHVSNTPSFPKKGPIALLAAAAVALLGLAHSVARELIFAQPDMRSANSVEQYGAHEQSRAHQNTKPANAPEPLLKARSNRYLLRHLMSRNAKRIVMTSISSSIDSSQQIIEMARALARTGSRVILVDATPIGDDIAIAMDIPDAPGLHHLLSRSANLEDAVRRDPQTYLHLISGGSETGQIQTIDPSSLAQLVEALEATYDRVVYFCGPSEAKLLITQPCRSIPSLVLAADVTSTQANAMRLVETILDGIYVQPDVTLLTANITTGWSLPQIPGWKRAAA